MKAILIDDEIQARKLLQNLILNFLPDVEVVAECGDLPNGVKAIRKHKADLVFLDIEMPGHSGLELLDFFSPEELTFSVIFTTAYSQYAIRAFKLNAIDYLLKPLDPEEVVAAVGRARKQKTTREQLAGLKQAGENQSYARIAVPVGQSLHFVDLSNVVYFKADNSA